MYYFLPRSQWFLYQPIQRTYFQALPFLTSPIVLEPLTTFFLKCPLLGFWEPSCPSVFSSTSLTTLCPSYHVLLYPAPFSPLILYFCPTALIDFMQLIPTFPLPILTSLLTCLPNFLLYISSCISQGHLNTACLNPNSSSFPSNLVFFPVFPILVNGSTCYTS